jgi:hypothetical protein
MNVGACKYYCWTVKNQIVQHEILSLLLIVYILIILTVSSWNKIKIQNTENVYFNVQIVLACSGVLYAYPTRKSFLRKNVCIIHSQIRYMYFEYRYRIRQIHYRKLIQSLHDIVNQLKLTVLSSDKRSLNLKFTG